jgi:hypothetical protein
MNKFLQTLSSWLNPAPKTPALAAQALLERASRERGQDQFERSQLQANAEAALTLLR